MKKNRKPQAQKMRHSEVIRIQELRRSNAAQPHGHGAYSRKIKHTGKEWS